jgi:hypothetical protein
MAKILKVSDMRKLESQLAQEKITYGRMVELIEEKVLQDCIPKDDLLAHLDNLIEGAQKQEATFKEAEMEISELTSGAMAMAYQIVRNFAGRQVPEIEAAKSKLDRAELQAQYENMPNPMQERVIAVISPHFRDFEVYVRGIYSAMQGEKSMVEAGGFRYITIEGKRYKSKYFHVNSADDAVARVFDGVEKSHGFDLMLNGRELFDLCYSRLKL